MSYASDDDEEYNHLDHSGPDGAPRLIPRGAAAASAPPLLPRAGKKPPPLPPSDDIGPGIGAITMDQIYVTDEIKSMPWFVGNVTREETEALLKTGKRSGNFLVREKVPNKTFVHSYLSLTRMIIIHNLIEFSRDGSATVDGKPWPHHTTPTLEQVIDMMQHIRRSRKGTKDNADPGTLRALDQVWGRLCPDRVRLDAVRRQVKSMQPCSFMLCADKKAGVGGYVCVINLGNRNILEALLCRSAQGYYLKYSELAGSTIQKLLAMILSNPQAAAATGVPRMRIPSEAELSTPVNATPKPRAAPSQVITQEDIYDDGDLYEDGDDIYEDAEQPLPGAPQLPPARGANVIAMDDDIYDDGDM